MPTMSVIVHGGAGTHALLKQDVNAIDIIERGVINAAKAGYKVIPNTTKL